MPFMVFKVALIKERSPSGKILHDGFRPLCWDSPYWGTALRYEVKKCVYPELKDTTKLFVVDNEGDEIELCNSKEGLDGDNLVYQYSTMLQKRFGEGIIKLYIEEPSQPVMKIQSAASKTLESNIHLVDQLQKILDERLTGIQDQLSHHQEAIQKMIVDFNSQFQKMHEKMHFSIPD